LSGRARLLVLLLAALLGFAAAETPVAAAADRVVGDLARALRAWLTPGDPAASGRVVVVALDEESHVRPPFAALPRALWTPQLAAVVEAALDAGAAVVGVDLVLATTAEPVLAGYDRPLLKTLRRGGREGRLILAEVQDARRPLVPAALYAFALGGGGTRGDIRAANMPLDPRRRRAPPVPAAGRRQARLRRRAGAPGRGGGARPGDGDPRLRRRPDPGAHALLRRPPRLPRHRRRRARLPGPAPRRPGGPGRLDADRRRPLPRRQPAGRDGARGRARRPLHARPGGGRPADRGAGHDGRRPAPGRRRRPAHRRPRPAPAGPAGAARGSLATGLLAAAPLVLSGVGAPSLAATAGVLAAPLPLAALALPAGLVLPAGGLTLAGLAAAAAGLIAREALVDRALRRMRRGFGLYLPPPEVDRLLAERLPELGGELREVTILFADLAGYTGFAEQSRPADLVAYLNRHFARLGAAVTAEGGFVFQYLGDGMLAVFGAPGRLVEHPTAAVDAAVACLEAASAEPHLRLRIGIATGEALVGNIGSPHRFNYAVVGDVVNLAARVEGLNKAYGTGLMVAESAARRYRGRHALREVDRVLVVGRGAPLSLYGAAGRVARGRWRLRGRFRGLPHRRLRTRRRAVRGARSDRLPRRHDGCSRTRARARPAPGLGRGVPPHEQVAEV
jgi:adenylate cyclase